ncbi:vitelline membrane outer layer protein 1 homolog [Homarus americanus]|uniref:vitelline membrane outer layer protein 1 homolog n=1 Tax=Homarus americanus TaxID=6706 RepID=UPI001C477359|nr:vitelline membrane outer layer protein 1 homolog [Homarus americanus]
MNNGVDPTSEEYVTPTADIDHVGVSIIQVTCIYPGGAPASVLTQGVTDFIPAGTWSVLECPGGTWMKGFTQAVTPSLGGDVDDDALANMRLYCSQDSAGSGVGTELTVNSDSRNPWGTPSLCPEGFVGCGLRAKVEPKHEIDNSAISTVPFKCCLFTA